MVFGAAIGGRIHEVNGVTYGSFIVPGLMMLSLLTQSISNASIGIYFPKFTGQIYELLSAPLSAIEAVVGLCRRCGDQVDRHRPDHSFDRRAAGSAAHRTPVLDDRLSCADFGRVQPVRLYHRHLGQNFEQLAVIPSLVVTPLTFLGGAFYSIDMLPPSGERSACSTRWSILLAVSGGASMARATSASPRASGSRRCSSSYASRC